MPDVFSREEKKSRALALIERTAPARPVWVGDDGELRIAHSSDFTEMLEILGYRTRA